MGAADTVEVARPPPTPREDLDRALEELAAHRQEWVDLPIDDRIALVRGVRKDFRRTWQRWCDLSVAAKGIGERTLGNDREWIELSVINRAHSVIEQALVDIRRRGRPRVPGGFSGRPDGRVVAHTFPDDRAHALLFKGITMETWLEPGMTVEKAVADQAVEYRGGIQEGRVALVLGAGNASSLMTSDAFHKMFHDLRVVVLKMNPVNSYLGPLLEEGYRGLIEGGFLRIVYGGTEVGKYLVDHPLVEEVHMTGTDRTFEAIVFGPGEEGMRRKAEGRPVVDKPVEGELGCITPWIVVPGQWSGGTVARQASKMAFWMMRHEGYVCVAPRVLVLWDRWPQRQAFIESLVDALSRVEPIRAYYPGSAETQRDFVAAHPDAIQIGGGEEDHVPWTVIRDVSVEAGDDICFNRESFSGMVAETSLGGADALEYLANAVSWCNDSLWGTLSATIVVSDREMAKPEVGRAVERAVTDLRYGTIAINGPGNWGFASMVTPWGGHPDSTITDVQSGKVKVCNFLMLHRPAKSVVRIPFDIDPYPFVATARDLDVFSRRLAAFEDRPSWLRLPGLYLSAKRCSR
jgi:acyl-CoA reductase-like NAD-dependent aldehyde dehydrogenase